MAQGPSSSEPPVLEPVNDAVSLTSVMTAGDAADGTSWRMAGLPDGLGAFDNGDGTMTVLMNHELQASEGIARAHGSPGAFVSRLTVDIDTLRVVDGADLIQDVFLWDRENHGYIEATTAFDRLCSADLPPDTAFFNPLTGLGYDGGRIFLNGEEVPDGRAFAHVVTGAEAGNTYELPELGRLSHENQVANPTPSDRTVVMGLDDDEDGQVYVYVGQKAESGSVPERAGLTDGRLYALSISGGADETIPQGFGALVLDLDLVPLDGVAALSGDELEALSERAGATDFLRPEDGAWDPSQPDRFYFVTTGTGQHDSRLWSLDFDDIRAPTKGGTLTMHLDGSEGHGELDNVAVNSSGHVLLQEDPGVAEQNRVLLYDAPSDTLIPLADHPPAVNGEPSGIIDVTQILGSDGADHYLLDSQLPVAADEEVVAAGQLLAMRVDLDTLI